MRKWDYKTILRQSTMGEIKYEIDGVEIESPGIQVELFKKLGQDGWEMVAHSVSVLPAAMQSMGSAGDEIPVLDENRQLHPSRQPSLS